MKNCIDGVNMNVLFVGNGEDFPKRDSVSY